MISLCLGPQTGKKNYLLKNKKNLEEKYWNQDLFVITLTLISKYLFFNHDHKSQAKKLNKIILELVNVFKDVCIV